MDIQVPYRVRFANSMNRLFVAKYRIERRRSGEMTQAMNVRSGRSFFCCLRNKKV